ncbi:hypothetical protein TcCL_Unassigned00342, partial [Trypanosoma cruzi]
MFLIGLLCVAVGDPCGCACGPKTKLFEGSPVGTMAEACGCHSLFLGICRDSFTCLLFRGQCAGGCAIAEWKERTGMEVRERRGQGSRWVSRRGGPFPPNPAPLLSAHSLSLRSILADVTSTQRGSGCHHSHECDRKGTCQLLRSEGVTPCGTATCHKPPRGVHTRHRAVDAECLRRGGH